MRVGPPALVPVDAVPVLVLAQLSLFMQLFEVSGYLPAPSSVNIVVLGANISTGPARSRASPPPPGLLPNKSQLLLPGDESEVDHQAVRWLAPDHSCCRRGQAAAVLAGQELWTASAIRSMSVFNWAVTV